MKKNNLNDTNSSNNNSNSVTQKCLFVSIIGEPNSGKSTLLNCIAGQKVSIVTHKIQTTRDNIRAIFTNKQLGTQLIFTDTPGLFIPRRKLERHIVSNALNSIESCNVALVLIDAKRGISDYMRKLLTSNESLKKVGKVVAVINKIDTVEKGRQFELVDILQSLDIFSEYFAISALKGHMVYDLVKFLESCAHEMQWIYSPEHVTDSTVREMAQEITREKIFLNLHKELPYSIKVDTEKWEEEEAYVNIYHTIFVLKSSHKKIILGKGGEKIKTIRTQAAFEISTLLEKKVNLYLHVKVRENWIDVEFQ